MLRFGELRKCAQLLEAQGETMPHKLIKRSKSCGCTNFRGSKVWQCQVGIATSLLYKTSAVNVKENLCRSLLFPPSKLSCLMPIRCQPSRMLNRICHRAPPSLDGFNLVSFMTFLQQSFHSSKTHRPTLVQTRPADMPQHNANNS